MVLKRGIALNINLDLSRINDCVNHELIIAKLAAYRLNDGSLRFVENYLSKHIV